MAVIIVAAKVVYDMVADIVTDMAAIAVRSVVHIAVVMAAGMAVARSGLGHDPKLTGSFGHVPRAESVPVT